ncbi:glutathione S-transferase [Teratosphaeria destructans]|uniref:Glutathione S-transferase n=1 Tax=Teratosphaeria destructans TaxID=418781 RepID=A0A9W7SNH1_9PEZI|nr:glutathione S-transferase [Teratosphaeria destructans]
MGHLHSIEENPGPKTLVLEAMIPYTRPLTLYAHVGLSPNPLKVAILLEELGVAYDFAMLDLGAQEHKREPYLRINPNGRVPALDDPNTGLRIWESGAIVEYLVQRYDEEGRFHVKAGEEGEEAEARRWEEAAWRYFQASGQGPYFGQKAWFTKFHSEKLPSAIERYGAEIRRVLGVVDAHLRRTGRRYLVGDEVSYVDLMWIPWNHMVPFLMGEEFLKEWKREMPASWAWFRRLEGRESVKKVYGDMQRRMTVEQSGTGPKES